MAIGKKFEEVFQKGLRMADDAGCGFLGVYHIGVGTCFKEYAPHLIGNVSGASAGAMAAVALAVRGCLGKLSPHFFTLQHS